MEQARVDVGAALGVPVDLAKPDGPGALVAAAESSFGRVDCLVNNVGYAVQRSFDELTDADWESMWQLNVMSYVRGIQAAIPGMRERGYGRIVNVSSTAGKRPSTGMPDYSVMKAAVLSLSRLVADVYAKDGILCNAVCPGPTLSPAWVGPGGLAEQVAGRTGKAQGAGARGRGTWPPPRPHGRARRDRRRRGLPLLGPGELRHRRRVERRRRHRAHHPVAGNRAEVGTKSAPFRHLSTHTREAFRARLELGGGKGWPPISPGGTCPDGTAPAGG